MHFLGIRETIDVVYVATFHEVIYIVSLLWTRERCSPGKLPHIMDLVNRIYHTDIDDLDQG